MKLDLTSIREHGLHRDWTSESSMPKFPAIKRMSGAGLVNHYAIEADPLRIGRQRDNDIVVLDRGVSRYHAQVERRDGDCFISSVGTNSGLRVSGCETSNVMLKHLDLIEVGAALPLIFMEREDPIALADILSRFQELTNLLTGRSD